MLSGSRAVSIARATKAELGISSRPLQGAYPEGVYEKIAQTVAEVVSKGYPGMRPEKSARVERLKLTAMQRAPIKFCFLDELGSAMLWEKVRRTAEDLAGYTIRESDVGEVVWRAGKYGVETLARLKADADAEMKFSMGTPLFMRPTAHIGRQFSVTYRLENQTSLSAGHIDNRAPWKKFETHELQDVAFITVNQDVWRATCESGGLLPRQALQNMLLTWYPKHDPRGKVLPYVEYWRYRTNACVEETADDRYDSITSINQIGRLSIQGRVPAQFWHTVYFEDTKTVIYTRGFEMNVPRGLHKNERTTEEAVTIFANERVGTTLANIESDAGSRDWRLSPRMKCYLCGKEILGKVCWCPHCHRPLAPVEEQLYGRPKLGTWEEGWFKAILTRLDEIKIKPRDMTVRLDTYIVDPWAVSGLLAALNPAEDLFIQLRTGFQVDEYSVRREPRVYKVDLTDAITKSIAVTKLILVMASKQYAHKHWEYRNEFVGEASRGPIAFYASKGNRAVARAALMFQQHPSGCSTRAITWFCPNLSYAYIGALKQAMVTGDQRLRNDMVDMLERQSRASTKKSTSRSTRRLDSPERPTLT